MTFRTKIFTPGALSRTHRDLIYKATRHKLLTADPGITVTMSDDEELRLQPLSRHDRPKKKQSLQRLLELLQDGRDWQNLPAFLEGMQLAGEELPKGFMEKFIRRANEQGKTGVMIRCVEMVRKTGVTLADPAATRELMLGIHIMAAKSKYQGKDMEKAVRQAQEIALLMQKPEHCGGRVWKIGQKDMRKDIVVLGIMLELRAVQPDLSEDADITLGRLEKTASKVMALWPQQDLTVNQEAGPARLQMEGWLPLWAAMKLALQAPGLKDANLRHELKDAHKRLTEPIEQAKKIVEQASLGRPRRCLHMYNDVKDL